jgi:hypothetical protein
MSSVMALASTRNPYWEVPNFFSAFILRLRERGKEEK